MYCENTMSSMTIQDLNDDCLIYIFSMLPIIDQIKIQRVCKRWSQLSFNGLKSFEVNKKEFWGIGKGSNIKINLDVFKNLLKLYGRKITHIDFSNEYIYPGAYIKNLNIIPSEKDFQFICKFCPNITSLILDYRYQHISLQCIAENFRNLIYFTKYDFSKDSHHDEFAKLLFNNRNLKSLSLYCENIPLSCFSYLNSESIEEIHIFGYDTSELVTRVFGNLKKIHSLEVDSLIGDYGEIVEMLTVIGSHLKNLKKLKLVLRYFDDDMDKNTLLKGYDCMITLTNLEELYIEFETLVNNDLIKIICNNCKKLKTLRIQRSNEITDEGMSKIKLLPNLQNLYVKKTGSVTGSFLSGVPKLKNLEFYDCKSLQDKEIINFLLSVQYIENLEIIHCQHINGTNVIDTIIRNIKDRKFKFVKIKINDLADIEILEISGEYYTRGSKKFCMECRERDWFIIHEELKIAPPCSYCSHITSVHKIEKE